MEIIEREERDGNVRRYKVTTEGTYFAEGTPDEVINLLEGARKLGYYVWFRLGDKETGRDWMDEYDVCGFVSRSTGPVKIPILLASRRSMGGGGILTDCILKLVVYGAGRKRRWQAESYLVPDLVVDYADLGTEKSWIVRRRHDDRTVIARFSKPQKARRWVDFITGRRLNK